MLANLAAACLLLLSTYVHWNVPRQLSGAERVRTVRLVLVAVASIFGLLAVGYANARDTSALAMFLICFGQVHVPMAVLMMRKGRHNEEMALTRPWTDRPPSRRKNRFFPAGDS